MGCCTCNQGIVYKITYQENRVFITYTSGSVYDGGYKNNMREGDLRFQGQWLHQTFHIDKDLWGECGF